MGGDGGIEEDVMGRLAVTSRGTGEPVERCEAM